MLDVLIKPTIGRDVLYNDGISDQRCTAKICYVFGDDMINIGGFDRNGIPFGRTSVNLCNTEGALCEIGQAEWMPWQIKQAKKQDAEDALIPDTTADAIVDDGSGD